MQDLADGVWADALWQMFWFAVQQSPHFAKSLNTYDFTVG